MNDESTGPRQHNDLACGGVTRLVHLLRSSIMFSMSQRWPDRSRWAAGQVTYAALLLDPDGSSINQPIGGRALARAKTGCHVLNTPVYSGRIWPCQRSSLGIFVNVHIRSCHADDRRWRVRSDLQLKCHQSLKVTCPLVEFREID